MTALEELVEANATISETVAAEFVERFKTIEGDLFDRLVDLLKKFPTRGGRFVNDATSAKLIANIKRVLEQVMRREELREAVRDLLPEFDRIAANTAMMHGEENDIKVSKALLTDTKVRMIDFTADSVLDAGYDARFVVPVRKVLFQHVNLGAEVLETESALRMLIHGQDDADGVLSRYAGQVARDSLNQYEGQVHSVIADLYELQNSRYVGNIIATSRCQCRRWVRMGVIPGEHLRAEIRAAFNFGSGMIPGTTPTTFMIYRGGYNCLHSAIPTRQEMSIVWTAPGGAKTYCKAA